MASIVSALKRKLISILPFTGAETASVDESSGASCSSSEEVGRPRKRQRLTDHNDVNTEKKTPLRSSTPSSSSSSSYTPPLVRESISLDDQKAGNNNHDTTDDDRHDSSSSSSSGGASSQPSPLLRLLPNDVLSHCLSYINTPSDRFALQVCCPTFSKLSNSEEMLANIDLGGGGSSSSSLFAGGVENVYSPFDTAILENNELDNTGNNANGNGVDLLGGPIIQPEAVAAAGGRREQYLNMQNSSIGMIGLPNMPLSSARGFILDSDTSEVACEKLIKFAAAGNMQAIYMIAMILCYCHENISEGIALLRLNATSVSPSSPSPSSSPSSSSQQQQQHHLPSIYALALILRDSRSIESDYYLNVAASLGYAPAWQEKLTAAEMRAQFGDLDANKLVRYLDPPCLNRLLARHYLGCQRVRKHQTSHCWNPLCGRWAYKALRLENVVRGQQLQQGQGGMGGRRRRTVERHQQLLARLNDLAAAEDGGGNDDNHHQVIGVVGGAEDHHNIFEPFNANDIGGNHPRHRHHHFVEEGQHQPSPCCQRPIFSIEPLLREIPSSSANEKSITNKQPASPTSSSSASESPPSPLEKIRQALRNKPRLTGHGLKVSRMKMCSSCRRAKYCSKLCQVYDWRSGRHKIECQFL
ncbi:hypothetical protein ACHAXR_003524 [Thalassiosira sp. AJA248-18]